MTVDHDTSSPLALDRLALGGTRPWAVLRMTGRTARGAAPLLLAGVATAGVAGSVLHMLNPPPFTHAWLGPWVAIGSGAIALSGSATVLLRRWITSAIP